MKKYKLKLHLIKKVKDVSEIDFIKSSGRIFFEEEDKSLFSNKYNKITIEYESEDNNEIVEDTIFNEIINIYCSDKLLEVIKKYTINKEYNDYLIKRIAKNEYFHIIDKNEPSISFFNIRLLYLLKILAGDYYLNIVQGGPSKEIGLQIFLIMIKENEDNLTNQNWKNIDDKKNI